MNKTLPLFSALLFCAALGAQTPYYQKTYDLGFADRGNAALLLGNGDIATGGEYFDQQKLWIQRLNPKGEVLWSKLYDAPGNAGKAVDIQKMSDGGILVVYRSLDAGTNATLSGWMKLTETGDVVWNRHSTTGAELSKALPLANGGYLLVGADNSAPGSSNALAVRIDENGAVLWHGSAGQIGQTERFSDAWENDEGFIFCVGRADKFNGDREGLLAKLAPNGTVLWMRTYGIAATIEEFTAIAPFSTGTDLLLAGHSLSPGFEYDRALLLRVANAGDLKWARTYELPDLDLAAIEALAPGGDQFVVSIANLDNALGSSSALMKIAQNGDMAWQYAYPTGGERDIFRKLLSAPGGIVAVGSSVKNGDENIYVARIAQDGLMPGSECCPSALPIIVRDAVLDAGTFTPSLQNNFGHTAAGALVETTDPEVTEICRPIDAGFSISDSSICPGECIDIAITGNTPGVTYTLSATGGIPDPTQPERVCYPADGVYFVVRVGDNGVCARQQTIRLEAGVRPDAVPNAFTPNGDGVNDSFKPLFFCPVASVQFRIYNRWGQKVFESTDPADAWDGKIDGTEAPSDVYVWQVEYEAVRDGISQKLAEKGSVALLR